MHDEVEHFVSAVVDVGHGHGKNVAGGLHPADQLSGVGSDSHELKNAGEGLRGDLVRVEFPQLGHGHCIGQNPNFFLGHGLDLLDLGELGCLVHREEVIPPLVVTEMQQAVIGQDLLVFESRGEQEFLIGQ